jgi:ketosteroid isomerase-like protein
MRSSTWLAALAVTAAAACQQTESPEQAQARMQAESDSVMTMARELVANVDRWLAAGQADSMVAQYAEGATVMAPGMPAISGRDSIRAFLTQMFTWGRFEQRATVTHATARGPLAVIKGTYTMNYTPGPGAPPEMRAASSETGKFLVHMHRYEGRWLVVDDMWNTDAPPAPPPGSGSRR